MGDDTISRKATICAMEGVDWYHIGKDGQLVHGANSDDHEPLYKAKDVYAVLNTMPSAQPEKRTEERTETHGVCLDAIDRQAAIDALDKRFDSIPMEQTTEILQLRKDLRKLPSAQPTGAPLHDSGTDYAHGFADGYKQGLKDAESERVRCKDCLFWVAHDKRCVYLNHGFAPNMWCCHGRRADE